ncbi:uncharacterized protein BCR38DRAFT_524025 [Pseudomassariella vexata]|uniref:Cellobiose dehydrogenase-like cytochrome domain-containing protein n=1 Tax=Pseudomassariella vexata TaxID=1141098 RepID=A0A1Y2DX49_9PEZI|nr:uncharacterized protein BCR38DRAFT_524025 [Pseudomassariella vexata]ORY63870.1 hypothetical protein BCR38DRAFT_524025 [Pseudomassariella vexata]
MRLSSIAAGFGLASIAQSESTSYTDTETGITFQSYTSDDVSFRVALPEVTTGAFDVILQIDAPATIGWVGWAWAGTMTYNPLTLIWPNGDDIVHASRMAFGYYVPDPYPNATYTVLKGTGTSGGRVKFTALCSGCTTWADFEGNPTTIDASQPAPFAFAFSQTPPETPADPVSAFGIHDLVGHWNHDLPAAKSADFQSWVAANGGTGSNGTFVVSPKLRASRGALGL